MFGTTTTTAVVAVVQVQPVSDEGRRSSSDGTATVEHVGGDAAPVGGDAYPPPPLYCGGIFRVQIGETHFQMESTMIIQVRFLRLISLTPRR
ncbi:unnamed protein product [Macrosiphum euphorbiae]|uniref:Uncharacterized protein n=1 Tax=Macrosiphum euphorbiae TaxID=13131 RepID=A0AAV0XE19_9HEMI|nr:unnamed protein product [Macrosiphum euphorbiae]